jgi:hypothetical protein
MLSALVICLVGFSSTAAAEPAKFPWLSIAPEVGYQFFGKGTLVKDLDATIGPRHGAVVKAHVDLGGDKFALELSPLYAWQGTPNVMGSQSTVGGEITAVYRFSSSSVYPNIGIGFHGTYILPNENIVGGTELLARVPLGMTWYFIRYLGLVIEGGFMFGGTGVRFKDSATQIPYAYALSEKIEYAFVLGFDLLVGLRFP